MPRAKTARPPSNQRSQRGLEVSAGGGTAGWSGIDGVGAAGLSIPENYTLFRVVKTELLDKLFLKW